jgi:hypothetical protein
MIYHNYMQYTVITKLIMEKGVDNVEIPESIKFQALSEAGSLLLKEKRYLESAKALGKANNIQELIVFGDWLSQQALFKEAAYFYFFSKNKPKIEDCAHKCMNNGHLQEAKLLFEALDNKGMLNFLNENFGI